MGDNPTFIDFRDALKGADSYENNGSNSDDIHNHFAEYGIGDFLSPVVTINGQSGMFMGQSQTFTTSVDGDYPPYSYQWYYKGPNDTYWNVISGATSSSYYHTASASGNEELKVVIYDDNNSIGQDVFSIFVSGGIN